jgi:septal ring factor EnvC (AmiA/AmiB activator)
MAITIRSSQKTTAIQQELDQERYNRMITEEELEKTAGKIKSLESQLSEAQKKLANSQTTLIEERKLNAQLKSQLEELSQPKDSPRGSLKDGLSSSTPSRPMIQGDPVMKD